MQRATLIFQDIDNDGNVVVTEKIIENDEFLTHFDITDVYVDFLRGAGFVLNELTTTRFS